MAENESQANDFIAQQKAQRDARRKLWVRGILSWKFSTRPWCKELYDFIRARFGAAGFLFAMMHRRGGKSTTALIIAIEECLREANTRVALVCGTKDQAQAICDEAMVELLEDCPREVMPRKIKNDYVYQFDHNGSKIVVLPADMGNWKKRLRGRKFKLVIFTEACFIDGIDEIVKVVLPTLRDVNDAWSGTMLLESTPPDRPGHPSEKLWAEAEMDGRTFFLPLSANHAASPGFVEKAKADCGGEDTVDFKREYELQFVYEDDTVVLPEFTAARAHEGDEKRNLPPIVREVARPEGVDRYGSMDVGGRDLTANLWGFYDFEQNLLVVEDELAIVNVTSDVLAKQVREKEKELWGDNPGGKLLRYADNNNVILLYDLLKLHGLRFTATSKDNKDAQINQLRVMIKEGQLAIHPRCKTLIKTMRLARRAKNARKGFEHGEGIGHADLLDALLYLVRNVRRRAMPSPAPARPAAERDVVVHAAPVKTQSDRALASALGFGRRLGR